jgi:hypothetical protein
MQDSQFFNVLEKFVVSRRRELDLKMARQKLKQVDRYRQRLIQRIEELEGQQKKS